MNPAIIFLAALTAMQAVSQALWRAIATRLKTQPALSQHIALLLFASCFFASQSLGQDFTIIALPDTQYYSASYPATFDAQTQWIVDNAASLNIKAVVGLGDIVDGGGDITQWQNADRSMKKLDAAHIPYFSAIGNHDYDRNDPKNRTASTTNFNRYFGPARYRDSSYWPNPYWRNSYQSGSNENFYGVVNINGKTYLILVLEFYPRSNAISWAATVVQNHPTAEIIVVTHSYEYFDNSRVAGCDKYNAEYYSMGADNDGDEMWSNLVSKYKNISLVLSAHLITGVPGQAAVGHRTDLGLNGNVVNQVLSNYQAMTAGGNGYLRILRFSPSLNQISVKTYSPTLHASMIDGANQFTMRWHNWTTVGAGKIVGRVRSSSTCAPLPGVKISYSGGSVLTNTWGQYTLTNVSSGSRTVTASLPGHTSVIKSVKVDPGLAASWKVLMK